MAKFRWLQVKSDDEMEQELKALTSHTKHTKSSLIRWLLHREYLQTFDQGGEGQPEIKRIDRMQNRP